MGSQGPGTTSWLNRWGSRRVPPLGRQEDVAKTREQIYEKDRVLSNGLPQEVPGTPKDSQICTMLVTIWLDSWPLSSFLYS